MTWWLDPKPAPKMFNIKLSLADDGKHKFKVEIYNGKYKIKTIKFGADGYSDFTFHKDTDRKKAYIARHEQNEDWSKNGILTAGFWARWLLWNKPTLEASMTDIEDQFKVRFI